MFLNLKLSTELKYVGFKEKCYGCWESYLSNEEEKFFLKEVSSSKLNQEIKFPETFLTPAPTYSQIIDWFRIEHNYNAWVSPLLAQGEYHYYINHKSKPYLIIKSNESNSYEKITAELIDKIIEIRKIDIEREKDADL